MQNYCTHVQTHSIHFCTLLTKFAKYSTHGLAAFSYKMQRQFTSDMTEWKKSMEDLRQIESKISL